MGNKAYPGMVGYDLLTEHERGLVDHLAYVWNQFNALPVLHSGDRLEFLRAIHAAQNIVCSRPYLRQEIARTNAALTKSGRGELRMPTPPPGPIVDHGPHEKE